jgi:general stress protein 26
MTREEVFDLIKDAGYGVLATVDGNSPKARPMMPYLNDDGNLLLAVLPSCRTIRQIQVNPKVEICYIDRKMRFARISGKAQLSGDKDKKQVVWDNVPMLRQYFSGPEDNGFVLIEIFSQVVEIMTPQSREPEVVRLN